VFGGQAPGEDLLDRRVFAQREAGIQGVAFDHPGSDGRGRINRTGFSRAHVEVRPARAGRLLPRMTIVGTTTGAIAQATLRSLA
jgi:hypothetical protein